MTYLCADIGGTKTWVAAISFSKDQIKIDREKKYPSKDFSSLNEILLNFTKEGQETYESACFGLAGVIENGESYPTNLPWHISLKEIGKDLSINDVYLINDLEAHAYGILTLSDKEFYTLNKGREEIGGTKALIAAGTGMGMAQLFYAKGEYIPKPSEGGHIDFAPRTKDERELHEYMSEKMEHVSLENVCSGIGIKNLYHYVVDRKKAKDSDIDIKGDLTKEIIERATAERSLSSRYALDMFVSIYGAAAGNLALIAKATGGIYIAGGIAPKILNELKKGAFTDAFFSKGRFKEFLKTIPVKVVLNDKTALLGTSYYCFKNKS